mmetsp:Transcript_77534/g.69408  ORF Transcript_77534/g.69408 Transcript_77534/m.69408 type:complete len:138 (-) Transcript_77534:125-538(-)
MSCTISYANKVCKILLPFNGTQEQFHSFVTKRLGLKETDRYNIISDNEYDGSMTTNQIRIKTHKSLVVGHQYKLIYICKEVKRIQRMSRARKLNTMRRKSSGFEGLPFSRQTVAFKSKKSWQKLLSRSSKLMATLKA